MNILENQVHTTSLFRKIQQYFETRYLNLNEWTEALDCLVHPEQRIKYWIQTILDVHSENSASGENKIRQLVAMMLNDVASAEKPLIGGQIGDYNKQFAKKWGSYFEGIKLTELSISKIIEVLKQVNAKAGQAQLSQGHEKLSAFSEYLSNLDNNDFYNPECYIEIPGQYEGALTSEPIVSKNVKIASIRKTMLILGSIRRPKRITVHGSNEKDYHLLIKGGEDLRLDQRVQQLFQIMNLIFKEDPAC